MVQTIIVSISKFTSASKQVYFFDMASITQLLQQSAFFFDMANITGTNTTLEDETQVNLLRPEQVNYILTIIINSITCPFTVLLNVMVIMAVKRRPRLQTNANILLACLAATDAFTGLTLQPSFILLGTFHLIGVTILGRTIGDFCRFCLFAMTVCSSLHLMLVTS